MQEFGGELPLPYLLGLERKHWQHNHRISTSLNYLICKKLMVDAHFQFSNYQAHLTQIDQFANAMLLKSPHQRVLVVSWLNTLIFNVAALNDEYKQQLSHSLSLQSNDSHNVSIEILDNLQHSQRQCLAYLLNASSLQSIVTSIKEHAHHTTSHRREHQTQYALLSTIHYLCEKMEITVSYDKQLGQKLQVLGQCSCECCQQDVEQKVRGEVNRLIFGNTQQNNFDVKELESKLNNNYNANLIPIASLIDANYYNEQTKRVLFKGTSLSGAEVIQKLGKTMLGSYNKNQLFSESMLENDRVFQLVLSIIQYRHFDLYAIWMHLLNSQLENEGNNKEQEIATLICNFLYTLLTEQQQFTDLIRYLAGRLTTECKFSTSVTMDLMKKLILNRFLLSPTLYYTYSQKQLPEEQFGTQINKIRLLFYPKKSLLKQSEQIEAILSRIIYGPGNNSTKQPRFHNKRVIYHLDQSLKRDYQSIYCDLLEQYPKNNERNTSSEISFSFVRHNTSGEGQLTNRKQSKGKNMQMTPKTALNINIPQENYSINSILSKLNQKTAHNLASPKSEKSSKTVHTQLTDAPPNIDTEMAMIEELVNRRRLLGVARRAIDQRMAKRAQERNKMRYYFNQVHSQFEKVRREIEKDANQVRINIDLL